MARRSKGDGSAYKRKDGRWTGFIPLENGKRKYFYGKTKKEVLDQIRQALFEQQKGTLIVDQQQTVAQYLEEWLSVHKHAIRPRSHERYEAIVRLHLVPTLGIDSN